MLQDGRVAEILKRLDEKYGTNVIPYLEFDSPWQFVIAVILSAQSTDARVNMVTPRLFRAYPTPGSLGAADPQDVENIIHSVGFYKNKAKNIIGCAREMDEKYDGTPPNDMESLLKLPGVGRKSANCVLGNIYNVPSVVVDTHVRRVSGRLGLCVSDDPKKIEYELMDVLPKDHWILWNWHIITLGRTVCTSQRPKCGGCFLSDLCPSYVTN